MTQDWQIQATECEVVIPSDAMGVAHRNRSYRPEEILAMINSTDGLLMASALMVVFFGGSNAAGMLPGTDLGMTEFKNALDQTMGLQRQLCG